MGGALVFILPPLMGALDLLHKRGEHEVLALLSSRCKGEAVGGEGARVTNSETLFPAIFSMALSDPQLRSC